MKPTPAKRHTPRHRWDRWSLIVALICLAVACGDAPQPTQATSDAAGASALSNNAPPGFLDPPPPPPTSTTHVLSGATVLSQPPVEDGVVVISQGTLVAWGKRGEVEMPNDSIGHDVRGKWIVAGTWSQSSPTAAATDATFNRGQPANLLILRQPPPVTGELREADLAGRVYQGELQFFNVTPD